MISGRYIEREPLRGREVKQFRDRIADRLADANNTSNHGHTRLGLAYSAILDCALLLLRAHGYRLRSVRGHHEIAIEFLGEIMGVGPVDMDYYLELAHMRHDDLYEAAPVTDTEVEEAIEAATELAEKLDRWLNGRDLLRNEL
jgi:hypothetical protein